jgi:hypothetical protein
MSHVSPNCEKLMAATLNETELWMALSDLFVDRDVDFVDIARNVCGYSMQEIELALFQLVAPICVWYIRTPAPSVWLWFTEEQVIPEIELLIETRKSGGFWEK